MSFTHVPVLLRPVSFLLRECKLIADFTLGTGGFSEAFLENGSNVYGIDRDPCQKVTMERLSNKFGSRFVGLNTRWSQLLSFLPSDKLGTFEGVVMDLGLCSTQIFNDNRGFSFKQPDQSLDMRMDGDSGGLTAETVVNTYSEVELAKMFVLLGQESFTRANALSARIVKERQKKPIKTVGELTKIFRTETTGLVPKKLDPATLPFQAIRMTVNDEVNELIKGLCIAEKLLKNNGLLVVLSYHSIGKAFFLSCLC